MLSQGDAATELAAAAALASELRRWPGLASLSLVEAWAGPDSGPRGLPNHTAIYRHHESFAAAAIALLAAAPPGLAALRVRRCVDLSLPHYTAAAAAARAIAEAAEARFPALASLELSPCSLGCLPALASLTALTSLSFSLLLPAGAPLPPAYSFCLRSLSQQLRRLAVGALLSLHPDVLAPDASTFTFLPHLRRLEWLDLSGVAVPPGAVSLLSALPALRALALPRVDGAMLAALAANAADLTSLRTRELEVGGALRPAAAAVGSAARAPRAGVRQRSAGAELELVRLGAAAARAASAAAARRRLAAAAGRAARRVGAGGALLPGGGRPRGAAGGPAGRL